MKKILKLQDYKESKKEQPTSDFSQLNECQQERWDFFVKVQKLNLLDRLDWLETCEMHRLINKVEIKTDEKLISEIQEKTDELNDLIEEARARGLKDGIDNKKITEADN